MIRRLSPSGKISFHIQDHLLVLVVIARLKQVLKIPNELKQCADPVISNLFMIVNTYINLLYKYEQVLKDRLRNF